MDLFIILNSVELPEYLLALAVAMLLPSDDSDGIKSAIYVP